jgi:hypothetical protein
MVGSNHDLQIAAVITDADHPNRQSLPNLHSLWMEIARSIGLRAKMRETMTRHSEPSRTLKLYDAVERREIDSEVTKDPLLPLGTPDPYPPFQAGPSSLTFEIPNPTRRIDYDQYGCLRITLPTATGTRKSS